MTSRFWSSVRPSTRAFAFSGLLPEDSVTLRAIRVVFGGRDIQGRGNHEIPDDWSKGFPVCILPSGARGVPGQAWGG